MWRNWYWSAPWSSPAISMSYDLWVQSPSFPRNTRTLWLLSIFRAYLEWRSKFLDIREGWDYLGPKGPWQRQWWPLWGLCWLSWSYAFINRPNYHPEKLCELCIGRTAKCRLLHSNRTCKVCKVKLSFEVGFQCIDGPQNRTLEKLEQEWFSLIISKN